MILSADQRPSFAPEPFLTSPFYKDVEPRISAGYMYADQDIALHGISLHRAIDFAVPRGTAILVPADGWAVCTYGEVLLTDQGQPLALTLEDALRINRAEDITRPDSPQPWRGYFGSFVAQIWHGQGRYTQYGHVDWVNERIPYYAPEERDDNLYHNTILRAPVNEFKRRAIKVRKGELLATVGMTGCGWGQRCYETAVFDRNGRPDFSRSNYTHWDAPHLHFMVFGRRLGKARKPVAIWDPFGIYGQAEEGYDLPVSEWAGLAGSLWV